MAAAAGHFNYVEILSVVYFSMINDDIEKFFNKSIILNRIMKRIKLRLLINL
jgi:hypothetical protein